MSRNAASARRSATSAAKRDASEAPHKIDINGDFDPDPPSKEEQAEDAKQMAAIGYAGGGDDDGGEDDPKADGKADDEDKEGDKEEDKEEEEQDNKEDEEEQDNKEDEEEDNDTENNTNTLTPKETIRTPWGTLHKYQENHTNAKGNCTNTK